MAPRDSMAVLKHFLHVKNDVWAAQCQILHWECVERSENWILTRPNLQFIERYSEIQTWYDVWSIADQSSQVGTVKIRS